jgi:glutamate-1-semialdehyde 2,1-aminomutase
MPTTASAPWCTPGHAGLIDEDRLHIHDFDWNDPDSFDRLLRPPQ